MLLTKDRPSLHAVTQGRWRFGARQVLVVFVATVIAMGVRNLLTPWLGTDLPFVTAFPAVAIVAFFSGITAGGITALACALWTLTPWLPPYPSPGFGWQEIATFIPAAFLVAFFSGQGRDEAAAAMAAAAEAESTELTVRSLRLSMLMAFVLPTLLFLVAAWISYGRAFDDARLRVDREARIAQEHASKIMENNESMAGAVVDFLAPLAPEDVPARERELHGKLVALSSSLEQVQSMWVLDSVGKGVASSRFFPVPNTDASDREYFRWHQTGRPGIYISEPLVSRTTNERFFDVSRRWEHDGKFAGVVSISLYPAYFAEFYRGMALDTPGLTVMMTRSDGAVIARWPAIPGEGLRLDASSALLKAMSSGEVQGRIEGVSSVDGEDRINAFRRLERYPIYVLAGVDRDSIIAGWQRQLALLAAFTFPIAMALLYVMWVALRRTRRELTAQQSLQREIEQRARIETALRHVQKLEALGRLTGGVAHDFNNLLTIVNNNLHLMRRLNPSLANNQQLAAMGRAVLSGERLTRQLLAFARRQPLQPEVVSVRERLAALLALIAPTLGARIEASVEVDEGTKAVLVDPAELELAIINLAVNAKDAMPEGGRLTLRARNAARGEIEIAGEFVVVTVADTGTGIDPELTERIFEPFFTTKPSGQGTGLGLSQVYGMCAQAGGTARVESMPGSGTSVSLYLPATEPLPAAVGAHDQRDDDKLDCNILLVEDNQEVAAATEPLLQTVGCTVKWAMSGDAARTMVDAEPGKFDIVLSDMAMPGELDGLGLAEYLRRGYPEIQVVLMTGYTNQLQEAMARRFNVLAKPCSPDVLMNAMRDAIRRRKASRVATVEE
ncbi:MAG TPA: ATP-binding protein [Burkholderiaceae bacterium]|nr:ATP-binding protein [Burkholderiaceae bacterium]